MLLTVVFGCGAHLGYYCVYCINNGNYRHLFTLRWTKHLYNVHNIIFLYLFIGTLNTQAKSMQGSTLIRRIICLNLRNLNA